MPSPYFFLATTEHIFTEYNLYFGYCNPGHMITYAYIESRLRFLFFILALPLYSYTLLLLSNTE